MFLKAVGVDAEIVVKMVLTYKPNEFMKKFKNPWGKGGNRWNESVLRSSAVDQIGKRPITNRDVPGAVLSFECYRALLSSWTETTKSNVLYEIAPQFSNLEKTESISELDQIVVTIAQSELGKIYEFQNDCRCCGVLIAIEGQDPKRTSPKDDAIIEFIPSIPSNINTGSSTSDFEDYDFDMSFDEMLLLGIVITPPFTVRSKNNSFIIRMMIKSGDCCIA